MFKTGLEQLKLKVRDSRPGLELHLSGPGPVSPPEVNAGTGGSLGWTDSGPPDHYCKVVTSRYLAIEKLRQNGDGIQMLDIILSSNAPPLARS